MWCHGSPKHSIWHVLCHSMLGMSTVSFVRTKFEERWLSCASASETWSTIFSSMALAGRVIAAVHTKCYNIHFLYKCLASTENVERRKIERQTHTFNMNIIWCNRVASTLLSHSGYKIRILFYVPESAPYSFVHVPTEHTEYSVGSMPSIATSQQTHKTRIHRCRQTETTSGERM